VFSVFQLIFIVMHILNLILVHLYCKHILNHRMPRCQNANALAPTLVGDQIKPTKPQILIMSINWDLGKL
jgi:hypothetical protein